MKATVLKEKLMNHTYDFKLINLYEDYVVLARQRKRYVNAVERFINLYGNQETEIYSAAGRSEVGGNHTDHQHGNVLAASINLDAIAVVSKREDVIKVVSDGLEIKEIKLSDLDKNKEEEGTSEAIIRGVVYRLKKYGYSVGGFNAYVTSDVLIGAGLSSSASFEVLIGSIISGLYNNSEIDMVTIAKAGQFAENEYFGKPCGLMDQCACAVGGLINIDFNSPIHPVVNRVSVDFSKFNHSLCIVDTKGSHANLTSDYAAIPSEMKNVSSYFEKGFLREIDENDFYNQIPQIREKYGDRAVLRAHHFFKENARVKKLVKALLDNDFNSFKSLIKESGESSYKYLQNVYTCSDPHNQAVSLALAMSEMILEDKGVCRVHGGGFAGTIQAFVQNDYVDTYKREIEKIFGFGSCHVLRIRKTGGVRVI